MQLIKYFQLIFDTPKVISVIVFKVLWEQFISSFCIVTSVLESKKVSLVLEQLLEDEINIYLWGVLCSFGS